MWGWLLAIKRVGANWREIGGWQVTGMHGEEVPGKGGMGGPRIAGRSLSILSRRVLRIVTCKGYY